MEQEAEKLDREFRLLEETYGEDHLDLVLATGYVKRLIKNAQVVRYMAQRYQEPLVEFQKIHRKRPVRKSVDGIRLQTRLLRFRRLESCQSICGSDNTVSWTCHEWRFRQAVSDLGTAEMRSKTDLCSARRDSVSRRSTLFTF